MREQSREQHIDLQTRFDRMEERAIAAEARADKADKRAETAEKRVSRLEATIRSLMDGSVINNLMQQIIDIKKQRDDARAPDKQNRSERYGRTSQKVSRKDKSDSEDSGDDDRDAEEEKNDIGGRDSVEKLPSETSDASPGGEQDDWTHSLFHGSARMAHVATIYHTLISTCRQMKISASEYFGKLFAKLVRGCTDMASLLPMNMVTIQRTC